MAKKINNKKANVEVKAATATIEMPVEFTAKAASEQKAREEKAQAEKRNAYIDLVTSATVDENTAATVEVKATEQAASEDNREVWEFIPTVDELNEVGEENETAATVEAKATEQTVTLEEFAASIGIKVDWNPAQEKRWLDGAAQVDGKYIFVEDAVYKNIEKHEGWRPTLSAVKNGKLSRIGRNFGDALIKRGEAVIAKGIVAYREEKIAEKAKAKAEKAAKKAASKK